jgi:AcrR family transcriptional regulator
MAAQSRGEETRSRILDAALEAFARYGYDDASVAEICRLAGVTKGGFYHHFPSKQALFLELLARWLAGIDTQLMAMHSGQQPVREELIRMTAMVDRIFQEASGQLPVFLEVLIEARHNPVVWQVIVAPFRKYRAFFSRIVQQGIDDGSLRPVDPDLASDLLMSFAVGVLAVGLLNPQGADWGQVAQRGMVMLLEGLQKPKKD